MAVSWARMKVLLNGARKASAVDSAKVGEAVEKARDAIDRLREILIQCKNVENAAERIRGLCG